jgi:hypothetical protein
MKPRRAPQSLIIFVCLLLSIVWPVGGVGQQKKMTVGHGIMGRNVIASQLYSDNLSLKITLMNLPGAATLTSYWEVEFQVFFVPEEDFGKTLKDLKDAGKSRELRPEYFPSRILLAKGKFKKHSLGTLKDRAFLRQGFPFKNRIPKDQQTSFSNLVSFYSVKVFDGKLKKDIYGSDVFVVPPFERDTNDRKNLLPRTFLFLNFFVDERGSLYKSNTKRDSESMEWNPN